MSDPGSYMVVAAHTVCRCIDKFSEQPFLQLEV